MKVYILPPSPEDSALVLAWASVEIRDGVWLDGIQIVNGPFGLVVGGDSRKAAATLAAYKNWAKGRIL